jgi:riboflavin kinase/FMN adenylyltransferase
MRVNKLSNYSPEPYTPKTIQQAPEMQIITQYQDIPREAKGCAIAIGNFDGVHKGHVAVIKKAQEIAASKGGKAGVLTFEPHPLTLLRPEIKPFRITTDSQKALLIKQLGIDFLFAINFDKEFSEITANDFIHEILVHALGAKHIVTGEDFIFGHNRQGNTDLLSDKAAQYNFGYTKMAHVGSPSGAFSSSAIRRNLSHGNLHEVYPILGRNFVISGMVKEGNRQGRLIGFPTINLELAGYMNPAFGVYAVKIYIEGREKVFSGAANIGIRPTINGTKELLEVHIFDLSENLYGKNVAVELIDYIRPEIKFSGLEELKMQILEDCIKIRKVLQ